MTFTELAICKGVGPVEGHTASAESPIDVINLLDARGFSVGEGGWIPKLPQTKNGGVYSDNPLADGRTPIAFADANVIEAMTLVASGASPESRYWLEKRLRAFAQAAHEHHTSQYQIEPVYLKWKAPNAKGPQYALIYSIDIAPSGDPFSGKVNELTITIEREHGWRGVRPGFSSKEWTCYVLGQKFTSTNQPDLISATIQNRKEWNGLRASLFSQNFIEIPADKIPGDLEALALISVTNGSGTLKDLYMGRTSKPDYPVSGTPQQADYVFVPSAASMGADASLVADTGAPRDAAGLTTGQRVRVTFATVTADAVRAKWNGAQLTGWANFSAMRGRYMAFTRARLSAAGTVALHLNTWINANIDTEYPLPAVNLTDQGTGGTSNTTGWPLVYLGVVAFPPGESRVNMGAANGIDASLYGKIGISLWAQRLSGTPELYIGDLILIPIDEYACQLSVPDDPIQTDILYIDNTGYFLHGTSGDFARISVGNPVELKGNAIKLRPGQKNRIHFLGVGATYSVISQTFDVTVNIVPRWSGVRDA